MLTYGTKPRKIKRGGKTLAVYYVQVYDKTTGKQTWRSTGQRSLKLQGDLLQLWRELGSVSVGQRPGLHQATLHLEGPGLLLGVVGPIVPRVTELPGQLRSHDGAALSRVQLDQHPAVTDATPNQYERRVSFGTDQG